MNRFVLLLIGMIVVTTDGAAQEKTYKESQHTLQNAGNPQQLSRFAIAGKTPRDAVGAVGGGKLFRGDGPVQYDGTIGMDYVGRSRFFRRIFLGWYHDAPRQPAAPSYKVDGPRVIEELQERRK